jgi:sarcosine oxidase subunit gamma
LAKLRDALSGRAFAVSDVSAGQVAMQLCGDAARHVLARGCTLDFDPSVFRAGSCAQSGLAKATALIALRDDSPRFDIFVRRSFADYVVRWLHHAGREDVLRVQEMPFD